MNKINLKKKKTKKPQHQDISQTNYRKPARGHLPCSKLGDLNPHLPIITYIGQTALHKTQRLPYCIFKKNHFYAIFRIWKIGQKESLKQ